MFSELEEFIKKYIIEFCEKNKLNVKNNDNSFFIFSNNRYYMYEDFLSERW